MEKWSIGKRGRCVITDTPDGLPEESGHSGTKAYEYYGGALVAESIWRDKDVKLIAAAPDLLEYLQICVGDIERSPRKFTKQEKLSIARKAIEKATK